jgi:hypothetical protein
MENNPPTQTINPKMQFTSQKFFLEQKINSNLRWFYWIGGMSILNSIIAAASGGLSFVVGLGITQVIDVIMAGVAENLGSGGYIVQVFGWIIDLVIAGFFIALGALSKKRITWLIIVGMVFYALDAILLLIFEDFYSALFHGLGLWGLFTGLRQIAQLKKFEGQYATVQTSPIAPQAPVYSTDFNAIPVITEPTNKKRNFWIFTAILVTLALGGVCAFGAFVLFYP